MNTLSSAVLWMCVMLVLIALSLALYRLLITFRDYTVLHVRRSEASMIPEQLLHRDRLKRIDFWGPLVTVLALVSAFLLIAHRMWISGLPGTR